MIYVEKNSFNRQIELLEFVASIQDLNVSAWLYPESSVMELAGIEVTDNLLSLVPVTTYENGFSPRCTAPISASCENIQLFSKSHEALKKNCDSLALYKNNNSSWLVATIGHEGMCLVQDESLLNDLLQAGYVASTQSPDWW